MFLSYAPRGTFPNSIRLRRHRSSVVRVVAGVFPGNASPPPPCRRPQSSFSSTCGGASRTPAIHGRRPKRNGLPSPGHRPSFRLLFALLIAPCLLSMMAGCAATHVAIAKRNLEVSTRMSDAVFLDPVGGDKRTAFIYIRNTSDRPNFDIETPIKSAIAGRGYRIVNDPEEAHFKLQAQVLSVSKMSITAAEAALGAGYGGAIAGVAVGGVVGATTTGTVRGTAVGAVAGGIVGGIAETIANAAVKDVTYVAITDVQISEKAREGVVGRRDLQVDAQQGMGGSEQSTFTEETTEKRYRTRVISTANKVNLQYEEAAPLLNEGLTRVLSGVF